MKRPVVQVDGRIGILEFEVARILRDEMGYSSRDCERMVRSHTQRIDAALRFLPRRLAMQIELLEVKRAEWDGRLSAP